jgi:hypothetical protein
VIQQSSTYVTDSKQSELMVAKIAKENLEKIQIGQEREKTNQSDH